MITKKSNKEVTAESIKMSSIKIACWWLVYVLIAFPLIQAYQVNWVFSAELFYKIFTEIKVYFLIIPIVSFLLYKYKLNKFVKENN